MEGFELNRLEFLVLATLYQNNCKEYFYSLTISEILEHSNNLLGTRTTIYKKLKKLLSMGYVAKGSMDNHAHTFYLTEKGIALFERSEQK